MLFPLDSVGLEIQTQKGGCPHACARADAISRIGSPTALIRLRQDGGVVRAEGRRVAKVGDQQRPARPPSPSLAAAERYRHDDQEQDREHQLMQRVTALQHRRRVQEPREVATAYEAGGRRSRSSPGLNQRGDWRKYGSSCTLRRASYGDARLRRNGDSARWCRDLACIRLPTSHCRIRRWILQMYSRDTRALSNEA